MQSSCRASSLQLASRDLVATASFKLQALVAAAVVLIVFSSAAGACSRCLEVLAAAIASSDPQAHAHTAALFAVVRPYWISAAVVASTLFFMRLDRHTLRGVMHSVTEGLSIPGHDSGLQEGRV